MLESDSFGVYRPVASSACLTGAADPVHERPRPLRRHGVAGERYLLEDLRVGGGDLRRGRRAVAEPHAEHVRVDRQVSAPVLTRPGERDLVVPLPSHDSVRSISRVVTIRSRARCRPSSVLVRASATGAPRRRRRSCRPRRRPRGTADRASARWRDEDTVGSPVLVENQVAGSELRHPPPALARRYLRVEGERLSLEPGDEVVGQRDALERRAEHELAGVEDERLRRPRSRRAR